MAVGDNNPRVFAKVIGLEAWRKPFDGERGEADLYIDVVFGEGRLGGEGAPIRFRLSLKRAEVHVIRDSLNIIDINRSSVRRSDLPEPAKAQHVSEKKGQIEGSIEGKLSTKSHDMSATAHSRGSLTVTETIQNTVSIPAMEVTPWPTEKGYIFKIAPNAGTKLNGAPWPATTPMMKVRDTKPKRGRGEPPEVRIEIRCVREDLLIEQIEFTDSKYRAWAQLPRKKQIAVEQFIKDEIIRAGFACGNLTEKFAEITLADVTPSVEQ